MPRITAANMQALKESMETLIDAWEDITEPIETWLGFQDEPPTDTDGREQRREARDELDSGLPLVWDAIAELAALARGR